MLTEKIQRNLLLILDEKGMSVSTFCEKCPQSRTSLYQRFLDQEYNLKEVERWAEFLEVSVFKLFGWEQPLDLAKELVEIKKKLGELQAQIQTQSPNNPS